MKLEPYGTYLENTVIPMRLACLTNSGWPVMLSLWYIYQEGALYCATQNNAKVVAHLRRDPRCAFEIASDRPPYCGIRGRAKAQIEPHRGEEVLMKLLHRYLGDTNSSLAKKLLHNKRSEVAICLQPVSIYVWNFADRMPSSSAALPEKQCPDPQ